MFHHVPTAEVKLPTTERRPIAARTPSLATAHFVRFLREIASPMVPTPVALPGLEMKLQHPGLFGFLVC